GVKRRVLLNAFGQGGSSLTFSRSGQHLYWSGGFDGRPEVKAWEVETGRLILKARHRSDSDSHRRMALSPDGRRFAVTGRTMLSFLDTATGQEAFIFRVPRAASLQTVTCVDFSPDGGRLLFADDRSHVIQIWDASPLPQQAFVIRDTLGIHDL